MSAKTRVTPELFAALADATRLHIVSRLCEEGPLSISRLSEGSHVTRQAVTKHLRVMEEARLLHCRRRGRETLWSLDERRLKEARQYLAQISSQWDNALNRLKNFVEE